MESLWYLTPTVLAGTVMKASGDGIAYFISELIQTLCIFKKQKLNLAYKIVRREGRFI